MSQRILVKHCFGDIYSRPKRSIIRYLHKKQLLNNTNNFRSMTHLSNRSLFRRVNSKNPIWRHSAILRSWVVLPVTCGLNERKNQLSAVHLVVRDETISNGHRGIPNLKQRHLRCEGGGQKWAIKVMTWIYKCHKCVCVHIYISYVKCMYMSFNIYVISSS